MTSPSSSPPPSSSSLAVAAAPITHSQGSQAAASSPMLAAVRCASSFVSRLPAVVYRESYVAALVVAPSWPPPRPRTWRCEMNKTKLPKKVSAFYFFRLRRFLGAPVFLGTGAVGNSWCLREQVYGHRYDSSYVDVFAFL